MSASRSQPDPARIRSFLAAVLRGEAAPWPCDTPDGGAADELLESIVYHGVAGLLLQSPSRLEGWPPGVLEEIHRQAMAEAMWELRHRDVAARLISAIAALGVPSLLLKGTAIAYMLYEPPATRPRGDTDLLVERGGVPIARRVLGDWGYRLFAVGRGLEWLLQSWVMDCDEASRHARRPPLT